MSWVGWAMVLVLANTIQTVTGFGATVLAVSIGAHFLAVDPLVVALAILSWLQSGWILLRARGDVRWDVVVGRIVPIAGVGLVLGLASFRSFDVGLLRPLLGGFVIAVALAELVRLRRPDRRVRPLSRPAQVACLAGGGLFHGLFASGGPLLVYYAQRALPGKAALRATLASLWMLLNSALVIGFALDSRVDAEVFGLLAAGLPGLVVGVVIGEWLHHRVDEQRFRQSVQVVLLVTGLALLA